jgi:hypothetical protein
MNVAYYSNHFRRSMDAPSQWEARFKAAQSRSSAHWRRSQRLASIGYLLLGIAWAIVWWFTSEARNDAAWLGMVTTAIIGLLHRRHHGILRGASEHREREDMLRR